MFLLKCGHIKITSSSLCVSALTLCRGRPIQCSPTGGYRTSLIFYELSSVSICLQNWGYCILITPVFSRFQTLDSIWTMLWDRWGRNQPLMHTSLLHQDKPDFGCMVFWTLLFLSEGRSFSMRWSSSFFDAMIHSMRDIYGHTICYEKISTPFTVICPWFYNGLMLYIYSFSTGL